METTNITPNTYGFLKHALLVDPDAFFAKAVPTSITLDAANYSYVEEVAQGSGMSKSSVVNELIAYARRNLQSPSEYALLSINMSGEDGYLLLPRIIAEGIKKGYIEASDHVDEENFIDAEVIVCPTNNYDKMLSLLPRY